LAPNLRIAARTQPARGALANAKLVRGQAAGQRLVVGIDGNKINAGNALFNHAVNGIAAAAAHTHDPNQGRAFHFRHPLYWLSTPILFCHNNPSLQLIIDNCQLTIAQLISPAIMP
jgi:hypothetical protein